MTEKLIIPPDMVGEAQKYAALAVRGVTPDTSRLGLALAAASQAERWIEPEQQRLRALILEAKSDAEVEAREYQIWYVEKYLRRAAEAARARRAHLAGIKTPQQIKAELKRIDEDTAYWFEWYAWGYDPRARTPLSIVPFVPFPKQVELLKWVEDKVFHRRTSGLIEKSRDEGATELLVRFALKHWLRSAGFSALLSTRKEDEVDSKKNQNTLFERARFQIRLLPPWQLPKDFNPEKHMVSSMQLANPENGNTILGEAPVENMGRGGRVTMAVLDEFAFWQFAGYPQYRSLSQTTDSIIIPSSVAGKLNMYADLAFDGMTPKFTLDWRDNPFKTKAWYDSLPFGYISPKMSRTTIAQEVDRDYDASQPGKVWKYSEPHIFITLDEFMAWAEKEKVAQNFRQPDGTFKIADDWRTIRTHDYGQSEGHDWSYLLGAQPHARYRLNDTHFVFVGRNLEPTGLTTAEAVAQWRGFEQKLGLRDSKNAWVHPPVASYHSHEQLDLREVLMGTYGEWWIAWDTDYDTGLERIQDWWTPVDVDEPNPFRPNLSGRCRLMFVSLDNDYQLAYNERLESYFVTASQTEEGFMTLRKEISAYHYAESELGKAVKAMRPVKAFDDIVDCPIAGTLIRTQRGQVPIEQVTTDDHAMTREGWRRVTKAQKTADGVSVYTLISADGHEISATGNHPIWTVNRGWVRLRGITVNDTLLAWQNQNESNLTDTPTFGIQTRKMQLTATISKARKSPFMLRFGNFIMALFSLATTSTMPTGTHLTTTLPIWSASWRGFTCQSMGKPVGMPIGRANIAPLFLFLARLGHVFARAYAKNGRVMALAASRLQKIACDVVSHLLSRVIPRAEKSPCTVREVAVRSLVKNAERVSVYNLNVAECPEYFANDILVHNCIRGYAVNWNRRPEALTGPEKVWAAMPEEINREAYAAAETDYDKNRILTSMMAQYKNIEREISRPRTRNSLALARWERGQRK